MRHTVVRGLEKNARIIDDEYEGAFARSVDDNSGSIYSPNSSGEFFPETRGRQQEHTLASFISMKTSEKSKKKSNKGTKEEKSSQQQMSAASNQLYHQPRGRLPSREMMDTQFEIDDDDDFQQTNFESNTQDDRFFA